jgi:hypothetical protein
MNFAWSASKPRMNPLQTILSSGLDATNGVAAPSNTILVTLEFLRVTIKWKMQVKI